MNYYSFHIGDYRRDTTHLSLLEHGVYRQLLDMYYLSEERIPEETEVVYRRLCARTDEEKKAVDTVLEEFFQRENGWIHKRCEHDISEYHDKVNRARINGKLGGRPPKTKEVISRNPKQTDLKANHKPLTINQEPIEKNKDTAASDGVNVCAIPDKRTRSKPPAVPLDYSAWPEQPSESVLTDWIAARKAKKLPVNQTVITRLGNELTRAVSAGLRVDDCLAEAVTRGWQGFKSEWMTNNRGDQHENRRSNSNGFNAIDPNDESWLTDDALAYIESGREIGNRVRAGKPLLRRDDDGVYRLATGDDG